MPGWSNVTLNTVLLAEVFASSIALQEDLREQVKNRRATEA